MSLIYPDHVGKSLLLKIASIEKVDNDIAKHYIAILRLQEKRISTLGEIKGMIEAEGYEDELRKTNGQN